MSLIEKQIGRFSKYNHPFLEYIRFHQIRTVPDRSQPFLDLSGQELNSGNKHSEVPLDSQEFSDSSTSLERLESILDGNASGSPTKLSEFLNEKGYIRKEKIEEYANRYITPLAHFLKSEKMRGLAIQAETHNFADLLNSKNQTLGEGAAYRKELMKFLTSETGLCLIANVDVLIKVLQSEPLKLGTAEAAKLIRLISAGRDGFDQLTPQQRIAHFLKLEAQNKTEREGQFFSGVIKSAKLLESAIARDPNDMSIRLKAAEANYHWGNALKEKPAFTSADRSALLNAYGVALGNIEIILSIEKGHSSEKIAALQLKYEILTSQKGMLAELGADAEAYNSKAADEALHQAQSLVRKTHDEEVEKYRELFKKNEAPEQILEKAKTALLQLEEIEEKIQALGKLSQKPLEWEDLKRSHQFYTIALEFEKAHPQEEKTIVEARASHAKKLQQGKDQVEKEIREVRDRLLSTQEPGQLLANFRLVIVIDQETKDFNRLASDLKSWEILIQQIPLDQVKDRKQLAALRFALLEFRAEALRSWSWLLSHQPKGVENFRGIHPREEMKGVKNNFILQLTAAEIFSQPNQMVSLRSLLDQVVEENSPDLLAILTPNAKQPTTLHRLSQFLADSRRPDVLFEAAKKIESKTQEENGNVPKTPEEKEVFEAKKKQEKYQLSLQALEEYVKLGKAFSSRQNEVRQFIEREIIAKLPEAERPLVYIKINQIQAGKSAFFDHWNILLGSRLFGTHQDERGRLNANAFDRNAGFEDFLSQIQYQASQDDLRFSTVGFGKAEWSAKGHLEHYQDAYKSFEGYAQKGFFGKVAAGVGAVVVGELNHTAEAWNSNPYQTLLKNLDADEVEALKFYYDTQVRGIPLPSDFEAKIQKLTPALRRIEAKFIQINPQGYTEMMLKQDPHHLTDLLKNPELFPEEERLNTMADLAKGIARVGENAKVLDKSEVRVIESEISQFNYLNWGADNSKVGRMLEGAVASMQRFQATQTSVKEYRAEYAEFAKNAETLTEEKLANFQYLVGKDKTGHKVYGGLQSEQVLELAHLIQETDGKIDTVSKAQNLVANFYLMVGDNRTWLKHEGNLQIQRIRNHLLSRDLPLLLARAKSIQTEKEFVAFNQLLQSTVYGNLSLLLEDSSKPGESVGEYKLAVRFNDLLEGMLSDIRTPFDQIKNFSDELKMGKNMGKAMLEDLPQIKTKNRELKEAISTICHAVSSASRKRWVSYKSHPVLTSRIPSNVAHYAFGEGDIADIERADQAGIAFSKDLATANSFEELHQKLVTFRNQSRQGGVLALAEEAAANEGIEGSLQFGDVMIELAVDRLTMNVGGKLLRSLKVAAEVGHTVNGARKTGMFMKAAEEVGDAKHIGALIRSNEGALLGFSQGIRLGLIEEGKTQAELAITGVSTARNGFDEIQDEFFREQVIAMAGSMALSGALEGALHAWGLEKALAKLPGVVRVPLNIVGSGIKESSEELTEAHLKQLAKTGEIQALSNVEFSQTVVDASGPGGVMAAQEGAKGRADHRNHSDVKESGHLNTQLFKTEKEEQDAEGPVAVEDYVTSLLQQNGISPRAVDDPMIADTINYLWAQHLDRTGNAREAAGKPIGLDYLKRAGEVEALAQAVRGYLKDIGVQDPSGQQFKVLFTEALRSGKSPKVLNTRLRDIRRQQKNQGKLNALVNRSLAKGGIFDWENRSSQKTKTPDSVEGGVLLNFAVHALFQRALHQTNFSIRQELRAIQTELLEPLSKLIARVSDPLTTTKALDRLARLYYKDDPRDGLRDDKITNFKRASLQQLLMAEEREKVIASLERSAAFAQTIDDFLFVHVGYQTADEQEDSSTRVVLVNHLLNLLRANFSSPEEAQIALAQISETLASGQKFIVVSDRLMLLHPITLESVYDQIIALGRRGNPQAAEVSATDAKRAAREGLETDNSSEQQNQAEGVFSLQSDSRGQQENSERQQNQNPRKTQQTANRERTTISRAQPTPNLVARFAQKLQGTPMLMGGVLMVTAAVPAVADLAFSAPEIVSRYGGWNFSAILELASRFLINWGASVGKMTGGAVLVVGTNKLISTEVDAQITTTDMAEDGESAVSEEDKVVPEVLRNLEGENGKFEIPPTLYQAVNRQLKQIIPDELPFGMKGEEIRVQLMGYLFVTLEDRFHDEWILEVVDKEIKEIKTIIDYFGVEKVCRAVEKDLHGLVRLSGALDIVITYSNGLLKGKLTHIVDFSRFIALGRFDFDRLLLFNKSNQAVQKIDNFFKEQWAQWNEKRIPPGEANYVSWCFEQLLPIFGRDRIFTRRLLESAFFSTEVQVLVERIISRGDRLDEVARKNLNFLLGLKFRAEIFLATDPDQFFVWLQSDPEAFVDEAIRQNKIRIYQAKMAALLPIVNNDEEFADELIDRANNHAAIFKFVERMISGKVRLSEESLRTLRSLLFEEKDESEEIESARAAFSQILDSEVTSDLFLASDPNQFFAQLLLNPKKLLRFSDSFVRLETFQFSPESPIYPTVAFIMKELLTLSSYDLPTAIDYFPKIIAKWCDHNIKLQESEALSLQKKIQWEILQAQSVREETRKNPEKMAVKRIEAALAAFNEEPSLAQLVQGEAGRPIFDALDIVEFMETFGSLSPQVASNSDLVGRRERAYTFLELLDEEILLFVRRDKEKFVKALKNDPESMFLLLSLRYALKISLNPEHESLLAQLNYKIGLSFEEGFSKAEELCLIRFDSEENPFHLIRKIMEGQFANSFEPTKEVGAEEKKILEKEIQAIQQIFHHLNIEKYQIIRPENIDEEAPTDYPAELGFIVPITGELTQNDLISLIRRLGCQVGVSDKNPNYFMIVSPKGNQFFLGFKVKPFSDNEGTGSGGGGESIPKPTVHAGGAISGGRWRRRRRGTENLEGVPKSTVDYRMAGKLGSPDETNKNRAPSEADGKPEIAEAKNTVTISLEQIINEIDRHLMTLDISPDLLLIARARLSLLASFDRELAQQILQGDEATFEEKLRGVVHRSQKFFEEDSKRFQDYCDFLRRQLSPILGESAASNLLKVSYLSANNDNELIEAFIARVLSSERSIEWKELDCLKTLSRFFDSDDFIENFYFSGLLGAFLFETSIDQWLFLFNLQEVYQSSLHNLYLLFSDIQEQSKSQSQLLSQIFFQLGRSGRFDIVLKFADFYRKGEDFELLTDLTAEKLNEILENIRSDIEKKKEAEKEEDARSLAALDPTIREEILHRPLDYLLRKLREILPELEEGAYQFIRPDNPHPIYKSAETGWGVVIRLNDESELSHVRKKLLRQGAFVDRSLFPGEQIEDDLELSDIELMELSEFEGAEAQKEERSLLLIFNDYSGKENPVFFIRLQKIDSPINFTAGSSSRLLNISSGGDPDFVAASEHRYDSDFLPINPLTPQDPDLLGIMSIRDPLGGSINGGTTLSGKKPSKGDSKLIAEFNQWKSSLKSEDEKRILKAVIATLISYQEEVDDFEDLKIRNQGLYERLSRDPEKHYLKVAEVVLESKKLGLMRSEVEAAFAIGSQFFKVAEALVKLETRSTSSLDEVQWEPSKDARTIPFTNLIQGLRTRGGFKNLQAVLNELERIGLKDITVPTLENLEKGNLAAVPFELIAGLAKVYGEKIQEGVDVRDLIYALNLQRYPPNEDFPISLWMTAKYPILIEDRRDFTRISFFKNEDPNARSLGWTIVAAMKNPEKYCDDQEMQDRIDGNSHNLKDLIYNRLPPGREVQLEKLPQALALEPFEVIKIVNRTPYKMKGEAVARSDNERFQLARLFPGVVILIGNMQSQERNLLHYYAQCTDFPTPGSRLFEARQIKGWHSSDQETRSLLGEKADVRYITLRERDNIEVNGGNLGDWLWLYKQIGVSETETRKMATKAGFLPESPLFIFAEAVARIDQAELLKIGLTKRISYEALVTRVGIDRHTLHAMLYPKERATTKTTIQKVVEVFNSLGVLFDGDAFSEAIERFKKTDEVQKQLRTTPISREELFEKIKELYELKTLKRITPRQLMAAIQNLLGLKQTELMELLGIQNEHDYENDLLRGVPTVKRMYQYGDDSLLLEILPLLYLHFYNKVKDFKKLKIVESDGQTIRAVLPADWSEERLLQTTFGQLLTLIFSENPKVKTEFEKSLPEVGHDSGFSIQLEKDLTEQDIKYSIVHILSRILNKRRLQKKYPKVLLALLAHPELFDFFHVVDADGRRLGKKEEKFSYENRYKAFLDSKERNSKGQSPGGASSGDTRITSNESPFPYDKNRANFLRGEGDSAYSDDEERDYLGQRRSGLYATNLAQSGIGVISEQSEKTSLQQMRELASEFSEDFPKESFDLESFRERVVHLKSILGPGHRHFAAIVSMINDIQVSVSPQVREKFSAEIAKQFALCISEYHASISPVAQYSSEKMNALEDQAASAVREVAARNSWLVTLIEKVEKVEEAKGIYVPLTEEEKLNREDLAVILQIDQTLKHAQNLRREVSSKLDPLTEEGAKNLRLLNTFYETLEKTLEVIQLRKENKISRAIRRALSRAPKMPRIVSSLGGRSLGGTPDFAGVLGTGLEVGGINGNPPAEDEQRFDNPKVMSAQSFATGATPPGGKINPLEETKYLLSDLDEVQSIHPLEISHPDHPQYSHDLPMAKRIPCVVVELKSKETQIQKLQHRRSFLPQAIRKFISAKYSIGETLQPQRGIKVFKEDHAFYLFIVHPDDLEQLELNRLAALDQDSAVKKPVTTESGGVPPLLGVGGKGVETGVTHDNPQEPKPSSIANMSAVGSFATVPGGTVTAQSTAATTEEYLQKFKEPLRTSVRNSLNAAKGTGENYDTSLPPIPRLIGEALAAALNQCLLVFFMGQDRLASHLSVSPAVKESFKNNDALIAEVFNFFSTIHNSLKTVENHFDRSLLERFLKEFSRLLISSAWVNGGTTPINIDKEFLVKLRRDFEGNEKVQSLLVTLEESFRKEKESRAKSEAIIRPAESSPSTPNENKIDSETIDYLSVINAELRYLLRTQILKFMTTDPENKIANSFIAVFVESLAKLAEKNIDGKEAIVEIFKFLLSKKELNVDRLEFIYEGFIKSFEPYLENEQFQFVAAQLRKLEDKISLLKKKSGGGEGGGSSQNGHSPKPPPSIAKRPRAIAVETASSPQAGRLRSFQEARRRGGVYGMGGLFGSARLDLKTETKISDVLFERKNATQSSEGQVGVGSGVIGDEKRQRNIPPKDVILMKDDKDDPTLRRRDESKTPAPSVAIKKNDIRNDLVKPEESQRSFVRKKYQRYLAEATDHQRAEFFDHLAYFFGRPEYQESVISFLTLLLEVIPSGFLFATELQALLSRYKTEFASSTHPVEDAPVLVTTSVSSSEGKAESKTVAQVVQTLPDSFKEKFIGQLNVESKVIATPEIFSRAFLGTLNSLVSILDFDLNASAALEAILIFILKHLEDPFYRNVFSQFAKGIYRDGEQIDEGFFTSTFNYGETKKTAYDRAVLTISKSQKVPEEKRQRLLQLLKTLNEKMNPAPKKPGGGGNGGLDPSMATDVEVKSSDPRYSQPDQHAIQNGLNQARRGKLLAGSGLFKDSGWSLPANEFLPGQAIDSSRNGSPDTAALYWGGGENHPSERVAGKPLKIDSPSDQTPMEMAGKVEETSSSSFVPQTAFGRALKKLKELKGISEGKMSDNMKLYRRAYSDYIHERVAPSLETLLAICGNDFFAGFSEQLPEFYLENNPEFKKEASMNGNRLIITFDKLFTNERLNTLTPLDLLDLLIFDLTRRLGKKETLTDFEFTQLTEIPESFCRHLRRGGMKNITHQNLAQLAKATGRDFGFMAVVIEPRLKEVFEVERRTRDPQELIGGFVVESPKELSRSKKNNRSFKRFGNAVRVARETLGISRNKLGDLAEIKAKTISQIEKGNAKLVELRSVWQLLSAFRKEQLKGNLSVEEFFEIYESYTDEMLDIDNISYMGNFGYAVVLPEGYSIEEVLEKPLADLISERIESGKAKISSPTELKSHLERELQSDQFIIKRILGGALPLLSYEQIELLADALNLPFSLVYLSTHKELAELVSIYRADSESEEDIEKAILVHEVKRAPLITFEELRTKLCRPKPIVGKIIDQIREVLGKTLEEFPEMLGVTSNAYGNYKLGGSSPKIEVFIRLAKLISPKIKKKYQELLSECYLSRSPELQEELGIVDEAGTIEVNLDQTMSDPEVSFADIVRSLRGEQKQESFAREIGLDRNAIDSLEKGKTHEIRFEVVAAYAEHFGVDLGLLALKAHPELEVYFKVVFLKGQTPIDDSSEEDSGVTSQIYSDSANSASSASIASEPTSQRQSKLLLDLTQDAATAPRNLRERRALVNREVRQLGGDRFKAGRLFQSNLRTRQVDAANHVFPGGTPPVATMATHPDRGVHREEAGLRGRSSREVQRDPIGDQQVMEMAGSSDNHGSVSRSFFSEENLRVLEAFKKDSIYPAVVNYLLCCWSNLGGARPKRKHVEERKNDSLIMVMLKNYSHADFESKDGTKVVEVAIAKKEFFFNLFDELFSEVKAIEISFELFEEATNGIIARRTEPAARIVAEAPPVGVDRGQELYNRRRFLKEQQTLAAAAAARQMNYSPLSQEELRVALAKRDGSTASFGRFMRTVYKLCQGPGIKNLATYFNIPASVLHNYITSRSPTSHIPNLYKLGHPPLLSKVRSNLYSAVFGNALPLVRLKVATEDRLGITASLPVGWSYQRVNDTTFGDLLEFIFKKDSSLLAEFSQQLIELGYSKTHVGEQLNSLISDQIGEINYKIVEGFIDVIKKSKNEEIRNLGIVLLLTSHPELFDFYEVKDENGNLIGKDNPKFSYETRYQKRLEAKKKKGNPSGTPPVTPAGSQSSGSPDNSGSNLMGRKTALSPAEIQLQMIGQGNLDVDAAQPVVTSGLEEARNNRHRREVGATARERFAGRRTSSFTASAPKSSDSFSGPMLNPAPARKEGQVYLGGGEERGGGKDRIPSARFQVGVPGSGSTQRKAPVKPLQAVRIALGFSQENFAARLHLPVSEYGRYEEESVNLGIGAMRELRGLFTAETRATSQDLLSDLYRSLYPQVREYEIVNEEGEIVIDLDHPCFNQSKLDLSHDSIAELRAGRVTGLQYLGNAINFSHELVAILQEEGLQDNDYFRVHTYARPDSNYPKIDIRILALLIHPELAFYFKIILLKGGEPIGGLSGGNSGTTSSAGNVSGSSARSAAFSSAQMQLRMLGEEEIDLAADQPIVSNFFAEELRKRHQRKVGVNTRERFTRRRESLFTFPTPKSSDPFSRQIFICTPAQEMAQVYLGGGKDIGRNISPTPTSMLMVGDGNGGSLYPSEIIISKKYTLRYKTSDLPIAINKLILVFSLNTDEMASWLGITPSHYQQVLEGKCAFTTRLVRTLLEKIGEKELTVEQREACDFFFTVLKITPNPFQMDERLDLRAIGDGTESFLPRKVKGRRTYTLSYKQDCLSTAFDRLLNAFLLDIDQITLWLEIGTTHYQEILAGRARLTTRSVEALVEHIRNRKEELTTEQQRACHFFFSSLNIAPNPFQMDERLDDVVQVTQERRAPRVVSDYSLQKNIDPKHLSSVSRLTEWIRSIKVLFSSLDNNEDLLAKVLKVEVMTVRKYLLGIKIASTTQIENFIQNIQALILNLGALAEIFQQTKVVTKRDFLNQARMKDVPNRLAIQFYVGEKFDEALLDECIQRLKVGLRDFENFSKISEPEKRIKLRVVQKPNLDTLKSAVSKIASLFNVQLERNYGPVLFGIDYKYYSSIMAGRLDLSHISLENLLYEICSKKDWTDPQKEQFKHFFSLFGIAIEI